MEQTTFAQSRDSGDGPTPEQLESELTEIAVQLWRLGNRLVDPETREPTEDSRIAYKRLQAAWDSLIALGIEVRDYSNQEVADYAITDLIVLAEEPRQDLTKRTVIETVKPAVFYQGRQLGMAEVIVGIPTDLDENNPIAD